MADELAAGRMTLVEHLTELRTRIIRCLLAIVVGGLVCWILYPEIIKALLEPYCRALPDASSGEVSNVFTGTECKLIAVNPLEGFSLRMTVATYGGFALAIPVTLWQLWRFIAPGLYKHEKRIAMPFVAIGVLLFALGGALAYWSLPRALDFLIKIGGPDLVAVYSARPYLSLVIKMIVAFGIGFEFPLVLAMLQMLGIVTPQKLAKWRRYTLVGITAFVAVITPSGDPITLLVLSVPMYLFYEMSILFGRLYRRRRAQAPAFTGAT